MYYYAQCAYYYAYTAYDDAYLLIIMLSMLSIKLIASIVRTMFLIIPCI